MTPKQVDAASEFMAGLIQKGVNQQKIISETKRFVNKWRRASERDDTHEIFCDAIRYFKANMRGTFDEVIALMPQVIALEEREGTADVRGDSEGLIEITLSPPIPGLVEEVTRMARMFIVIIEVLESEQRTTALGS